MRYTYTTSIVMSSKELADWMFVEYLKELSKEYCGGVWVALWNGDMYLGQFLFNTDVCIPEPIPQVWTEFMEEVK
ncbi:hypothetical protein [Arsenophonus apicola]|uniref:Phage protein n=1 Tax=Arsenophonus apicola TaxID=2879119 RepID=A0ABY8NYK3_9GAMM|nr:hypothetical protein [Arsenophonus apicola]WGO82330.1 hypothetical protein QG404_00930 [Arsenophonus apicola]